MINWFKRLLDWWEIDTSVELRKLRNANRKDVEPREYYHDKIVYDDEGQAYLESFYASGNREFFHRRPKEPDVKDDK